MSLGLMIALASSESRRGTRPLGGRPHQWVENSHIATLVERHSRFTMLVKVTGKGTESVVAALKKQITKLPSELRQ